MILPIGFTEIRPGLFYHHETGRPFSRRTRAKGKGWTTDGPLRPLTGKNGKGYYRVRHGEYMYYWHRLVWEHFNGAKPGGMDIDHANNDTADNRVENLQLLTHKQNTQRSRANTNNSTGYPGVTWNKRKRRYTSQIGVDGRAKYLGLFDDPKEAYQAYLDAKTKYHGAESVRALPAPH